MGIVETVHEMWREEGVEEGVRKGLETAVRKLLSNTEFSVEKIAELMEVPVSMVKKVEAESNRK